MQDQNKNLILALVLSTVVIIVWTFLFPPEVQAPATLEEVQAQQDAGTLAVPGADAATTDATALAAPTEETEALAEAPRIPVQTPELDGSISLLGGRIDDLRLTQYRETTDDGSPTVTLLSPSGTPDAYFASFGWTGVDGVAADAVPGPDTLWTLEDGTTLTPDTPVTLAWDNGAGQIFRNAISVDDRYMFSVAQSVENTTDAPVSLRPYGLLRQEGTPSDLQNFFILHEGLVRMTDGTLEEVKYKNMVDFEVDDREGTNAERFDVTQSGWIGYTDHYWMTTLIPDQTAAFRSTAKYFPSRDIFQAEAVREPQTVAAGATTTITTQLFAGAKEWEAIRDYQQSGVTGFIDSIDWGWFFFLTKPIFWVLHHLNLLIGNMGWSIIALTFLLKLLVLPLAYKSYVSMARMKELQPEMEKLKERTGDDKAALQQGMMKLYKDNKVNPAAGCLPILIQIPIFFSLYKVIFVTLELRHAPWFGWINDLSAPDPSSILNLFGLLPWATPEPGSIFFILSLGVLPILLGISMWLQQKLNPAPTDPTQQMIFAWMPWVFMFMLGSFASGLVIYWIANNTITFAQQYLIMRSHGARPDVFGNIKSTFNRRKTAAAAANANTNKKPK
ncbi:protein translocase subunit yidC [Loktanella fryxellensis]|uniref:Membrane protein insertase YidC n=1 Tax=Loktanella fryxellensis TaxID=245187 RepID=A0A1H8A7K0_9RHOB|nr:membrane protein insertase YidC [Loktanella fryxellensis]SEM65874.1 protein translocase subunit yidC [Loktanella fryxellensis]